MSNFIAWPEIKNFYNLRRSFIKFDGPKPTVEYMAKVKLHGTNASVRINTDGSIHTYSRSGEIFPTKDNLGFSSFVFQNEKIFKSMAMNDRDLIMFGEWCGPGVQKGVAISKIPNRIFAIFSVMNIIKDDCIYKYDAMNFECEPVIIENFFSNEMIKFDQVKIISWYNDTRYKIDWSQDSDSLTPIIDQINQEVLKVEKSDPWVKKIFAVDGIGEGLVLYPISDDMSLEYFSNYAFKAKGEKHNTIAHTKPVQADPTIVSSSNEFAKMVLTESRLIQGVQMVDSTLSYDRKFIGPFLKWIAKDVEKECVAELEASKLDKKLALKMCSDYARDWYLKK